MAPDAHEDVVSAARALAAHGLVTAFGHVSARVEEGFLITPPQPLGSLLPGEPLQRVSLLEPGLPGGVPGEAWIHRAIYERRPGVLAVCRAQPRTATALAVADVPIRALHGQGAFLGREVPVLDDATLIRDRDRGEALADRLGDGAGILLRGNGAVTVGASVGEAAARMWVLEASAEINWRAAAAGSPRPLGEEEFAYWASVGGEILARIWQHMKTAEPG